MGFDTLVDATELESNLTAVADSIRAKTGQSGALAFPDGMVSAVNSIQTAPGWIDKMVNAPYLFQGQTLPEKCEFDFSFMPVGENAQVNMTNLFSSVKGVKEIAVTLPPSKKVCIGYIFNNAATVEKIVFKGDFDFSLKGEGGILSGLGAFAMCSKLTTIESPVTFGGNELLRKETTSYNTFFNCAKLVNVRFTPNSAQQDWMFKWSPSLSDATLISVANALTAGEFVLTLHATAYARCAQIKGRVDTSIEGECFIADENGDITLETYITENKGWSLANA